MLTIEGLRFPPHLRLALLFRNLHRCLTLAEGWLRDAIHPQPVEVVPWIVSDIVPMMSIRDRLVFIWAQPCGGDEAAKQVKADLALCSLRMQL